jgi:hypothetical protein
LLADDVASSFDADTVVVPRVRVGDTRRRPSTRVLAFAFARAIARIVRFDASVRLWRLRQRLLPSVGAARRTHATRASSLAASAVDGNTDVVVVDRRRRIARRREPTTRVVAVSVRVRVRIGEPRSKRRSGVWIRSAVFNDDWERDGER